MKERGPSSSSNLGFFPAQVDIDRIVKEHFSRNKSVIPTGHAEERLNDRTVTMGEVRQVLTKRGSRASRYDEYQTHDDAGTEINRWSYAFVGGTSEGRQLRVCVSILEKPEYQILLVTVCEEE